MNNGNKSRRRSVPRVGLKLLPDGGLQVDLLGAPIPGFKNRKRVCGKKLVTERSISAWMSALESSIESKLLYDFPIAELGTSTVARLRFLMSLLPSDDRWTIVRELTVRADLCPAGDEGATIIIEEFFDKTEKVVDEVQRRD